MLPFLPLPLDWIVSPQSLSFFPFLNRRDDFYFSWLWLHLARPEQICVTRSPACPSLTARATHCRDRRHLLRDSYFWFPRWSFFIWKWVASCDMTRAFPWVSPWKRFPLFQTWYCRSFSLGPFRGSKRAHFRRSHLKMKWLGCATATACLVLCSRTALSESLPYSSAWRSVARCQALLSTCLLPCWISCPCKVGERSLSFLDCSSSGTSYRS